MSGERDRYAIRLFNPLGNEKEVEIKLPILEKKHKCRLGAYGFKTLAVELDTGDVYETDLLERRI
jgi:hypothetical protein